MKCLVLSYVTAKVPPDDAVPRSGIFYFSSISFDVGGCCVRGGGGEITRGSRIAGGFWGPFEKKKSWLRGTLYSRNLKQPIQHNRIIVPILLPLLHWAHYGVVHGVIGHPSQGQHCNCFIVGGISYLFDVVLRKRLGGAVHGILLHVRGHAAGCRGLRLPSAFEVQHRKGKRYPPQ